MAAKVLLCIGCDAYEHIGTLNGAERDAKAIQRALTASEWSCIPAQDALLLLSPSSADLDRTLVQLQDRYEQIESFTIFFAGHGAEANDSYFLCLRDTRGDRLSTTGFALSRLFEFFNELKAAHCNVIIDACHAGGMVSNLSILLKPEVIGKANTFGVSFFVSSATDQYATETCEGGYGTVALLSVLSGDRDTGLRAGQLDLLDIGRPAAKAVSEKSEGQQMPSVWGINLYGHMPIYGNPHADEASVSSFLGLTGISPLSAPGKAISEYSSELYGLVFAPDKDLTPEKLLQVLGAFAKRLEPFPDSLGIFIAGVWKSLEKRLRSSRNSFAVVEFSAACISLALGSALRDKNSSALINALAHQIVMECECLLLEIADDLSKDYRALSQHGIPDLFYLPQRISRILGWAGASLHIAGELGRDDRKIRHSLQQISGYVVEHYAAVCAGMSEEEAPYWAALLTAVGDGDIQGLGELVLSTLFNALVEYGGGLARPRLEAGDIYGYLKARAKKDLDELQAFSASPSEILGLVMLASGKFSLSEELDRDLESLDHAYVTLFIPDCYLEFGQPYIENGISHVFQIGQKVWTMDDLLQRWNEACLPQLLGDESLNHPEVRIGALCSSLVMPDRVPWYLLMLSTDGHD